MEGDLLEQCCLDPGCPQDSPPREGLRLRGVGFPSGQQRLSKSS